MAYMEFKEQIKNHITFLRSKGCDINTLKMNIGFVNCRRMGQTNGRGVFSYATTTTKLRDEILGILTTCRCAKGIFKTHKTYGKDKVFSFDNSYLDVESKNFMPEKIVPKNPQLKKIQAFWNLSNTDGQSDYLLRKRVGSYGIRFRRNNYGKVAVVPIRNVLGDLKSYQLLNPDGIKRFAKNGLLKGHFHSLRRLVNGGSIGIAESYVTAATCYELLDISIVCAFSSWNLPSVGKAIRKIYPDSPIILFADHDRYLHKNHGLEKAQETLNMLKDNCMVLIPEFEGYPADKDHSDWNDLVTIKDRDEVRKLINHKKIQNNHPEKIKTNQ